MPHDKPHLCLIISFLLSVCCVPLKLRLQNFPERDFREIRNYKQISHNILHFSFKMEIFKLNFYNCNKNSMTETKVNYIWYKNCFVKDGTSCKR